MFRYNHNCFRFRIFDAYHTYYFVLTVFIQCHTTYTGGSTSHNAHSTFMETNGTSVTVGNDDFIVTVCHTHFDYTVVFTDSDSIYTILART